MPVREAFNDSPTTLTVETRAMPMASEVAVAAERVGDRAALRRARCPSMAPAPPPSPVRLPPLAFDNKIDNPTRAASPATIILMTKPIQLMTLPGETVDSSTPSTRSVTVIPSGTPSPIVKTTAIKASPMASMAAPRIWGVPIRLTTGPANSTLNRNRPTNTSTAPRPNSRPMTTPVDNSTPAIVVAPVLPARPRPIKMPPATKRIAPDKTRRLAMETD